jgi:hypothetical protein
MKQDVSTVARPADWLGLQRLAELLQTAERRTGHASPDEVVDRLQRTLEILGLVEDNASWLRAEARHGTPHETMQLASDLRRLANRVEGIGAFLLGLGNGVIDLEEQVLVELDERIRRQSEASPVTSSSAARDERPALECWAVVHAA